MSHSPSIPPYKPPKEIQDILNKQATQRKRTVQLPKRSWIQRNPRTFQISCITVSLLVLFSKPIYDAFVLSTFKPTEEPIKSNKQK